MKQVVLGLPIDQIEAGEANPDKHYLVVYKIGDAIRLGIVLLQDDGYYVTYSLHHPCHNNRVNARACKSLQEHIKYILGKGFQVYEFFTWEEMVKFAATKC